jgi:hypothetical protein
MFALLLELSASRGLDPLLSHLLNDWPAIEVINSCAMQLTIAQGSKDLIYFHRDRDKRRVEPDEWIAERSEIYKMKRAQAGVYCKQSQLL